MSKVSLIGFCETCKKEFYQPIYKQNKTCSKECRSKYFSFIKIQSGFKPPPYASELSRKAVNSEEYKIKRKKFYKDNPEIVKRMVENIKSSLINGKQKKWVIEKQQKSLENYRSSEEFKQHVVDISKIAHKKRSKDTRFQAGPHNMYSKEWCFRSPTNLIFKFKNLRDFIRKNPHFFNEEDVVWKKCGSAWFDSCRALGGLASLKPSLNRKRINGSWKGWTWYSQEEKFYNQGKDLLRRKI